MISEPLVGIYSGELLDRSKYIIYSKEYLKNRKVYYKNNKNRDEQYKNSKINSNEYGKFIWLLFKYTKELFPKLNLASITRLFMMATFINYNGYLSFDNGKTIDKNKLKYLLGLKDTVFRRFYNLLLNNKLIIEKNNKIYINELYFSKGKISKYISEDNNMIRIYTQFIREIYTKTKIDSHKELGYLFKLIPYLNIQHNVICHNPLESDTNKIIKMKFSEICDILDYDQHNINRLYCIFSSIVTKQNNNIVIFTTYNTSKKNWFLYINPSIFYAGDNWDEVKTLSRTK